MYLLNNPGDVELAIETLVAISRRMDELCAAADVALAFLYLPPPLCGQPERYPEESAGLRALLAEHDVDPVQPPISAMVKNRATGKPPHLA